jgi:uncharacterized protein (TIGR03437 family)
MIISVKNRIAVALAWMALGLCPLKAQPSINGSGVLNAAAPEMPGLARGGYFSIFGRNLGTSTATVTALPIPTTLGGAQVRIKPAGSTTLINAFLYFVSPGQINAVMPSTVPEGDADVTVTVGTATSPVARVRVERNRPGIFTIGSLRNGLGIAQNYESPVSQPLNVFTNPARPGQTLIIWATGLGPLLSGSDANSPVAGNIVTNAEVLVAGKSFPALYAGRAPGIPGVDQINFTLPNDSSIPDGCYIPLQIKIGTVLSNITTISKTTSGAPCRHPFSLSDGALTKLQYGERIPAGIIELRRDRGIIGIQGNLVISTLTETVKAYLVRFGANDITEKLGSIFAPLTIEPGTCSVTRIPDGKISTDESFGAHPLVGSAGGLWLRAGELTLTGNGQTVKMTGGLGSNYSGEISQGSDFPPLSTATPLLKEGTWNVRGTGGQDLGSFSADIDVQSLFKLSKTIPSITRGQPLEISWTGGGGDQDIVTILLGTLSLQDPSTTKNVVVQCAARASSQRFTVPPEFTGELDAAARAGFLWISSQVTNPAHFSAPLVGGGTLDGVSTTVVSEVNLKIAVN